MSVGGAQRWPQYLALPERSWDVPPGGIYFLISNKKEHLSRALHKVTVIK